MAKGDLPADPRGLIFEAYAMEIGPEDCRTIFLDWAIGLTAEPTAADIRALLARYAPGQPDHPMTAVLRAGLERAAPPTRRGGRRGRRIPHAPDP
jgi:hypothetical protein